ncbi:RHS repeat domain-containing protein [Flavobacterium sp.]|uniref:RHS repeat domain-containing protein n=1 Tax=Flavobacterium sp. TaxID=239 RepID=UPI0033404DF3
MKHSINIYITFFLLCSSNLFSQTASSIKYPTAGNIYEFSKYIETPVNEYRGLINIEVPLHNIEIDGINFPLTARNYTGGIKVNEEAGLIGLGWSIDMPKIVQEINDINDYGASTIHSKLPPFQGNPAVPSIGPYKVGYYVQWNQNMYGVYPLSGIQKEPFFYDVIGDVLLDHNGMYSLNNKYYYQIYEQGSSFDTESDIFTVNLFGETIKFTTKNSERNPVGMSGTTPFEYKEIVIINGKKEYKIETINESTALLKIKGFLITDNKGNKFYFDKVNKQLIYPSLSDSRNVIFSLTKIITSKGNEVILSYSKIENYFEMPSYVKKYITCIGGSAIQSDTSNLNATNFYTLFGQGDSNLAECQTNQQITDPYDQHLIHNNSEDIVTQIKTSNETVNFNYDSRVDVLNYKKIGSITVSNNTSIIKNIDFNYDYFVTNNTSNCFPITANNYISNYVQTLEERRNKRLKLMDIQINDEKYSFEYFDNVIPAKNSFSTDFWGYFNGVNNVSFNPPLNLVLAGNTYLNNNSTNNFNSNLEFTKTFTLKKIIYPTKGYSEFVYENNVFDRLFLQDNLPIINSGAGLRIKEINKYNFDGQLLKSTKYNYVGGKTISKRVLSKNQHTKVAILQGGCSVLLKEGEVLKVSLNNNINISSISEQDYVGYDKVEISELNNGKIVKTFSNNENKYISEMFYFNNDFYKNGTLLSEQLHNSSNEKQFEKLYSYENIHSTDIIYNMNVMSSGVWAAHRCSNVVIGEPNSGFYLDYYTTNKSLLTFYSIYDFHTRLKETRTTEFFNNSSKTILERYSYDSYNNLANKRQVLAPNTLLSEESVEFTYLTNSIHLQKNYLSYPKSIKDFENSTFKSRMDFDYNLINNSINKSKETILFEDNANSVHKKTIYYDLYDDKNNVVQYHNEHDISTAIIWGYNKSNIIAKIENIQYTSIPASIITNLQNLSNTGTEVDLITALNILRGSILPNALVTTYTHIPLIGVSTITDPKGDTQTYHYDSFNRLEFVKDRNGNILSENKYHYKN